MLVGPATVLLGYLLGAIPFGYLLVKLKRGEDVRGGGSGSTGATNVARAAGPALGLLTLVLDAAKGYVAVEAAARLAGAETAWPAAAALAAIVGHSYPVFLRFRGGKSVATALGAFGHFTPLAVGAALGVWLVVVGIWRYVSLASALAAASYPLLAFALQRPPLAVTLAAVAGASLVIFRHRSNIERLIAGTEPRLTRGRKP